MFASILMVACLPTLGADPADGITLMVDGGSGSADVTLSWTGGVGPYRVYRSSTATDVTDPGNFLTATTQNAILDTPPAGGITFYRVIMCADAVHCASGQCVDGWCCDSSCGSTCRACNLPGSEGLCSLIPSGADPDDECPGAEVCDGSGVCVLRQPNGSICSGPGECASGICTDGVCCASFCNGLCETCAGPGREGFCDPIPAGQDPADECSAEPVTTCGRTGLCGGNRSCQLQSSGTICLAASCSGAQSQLADLCDGNGACVDGGTQACSPYACNATTGLCRTTCTSNANCAAGYSCKASTGQCLLSDGGTCTLSSQCLSGACCTGICRNLGTDTSNCGSCGLTCTNPNGTTSCSSGLCAPICSSGASNCDSIAANGCEVRHGTYPNACASATNLGSLQGDIGCGEACPSSAAFNLFATQTGRTSAWFRARALEQNTFCTASIEHQIRLTVPAGVDYDLYAYTACGTLAGSSTQSAGIAESVTLCRADTGPSDNSYDYWVEVRWITGVSCSNWTLQLYGH